MEWTLRAVEGMDIPRAEKEKIYLENAVELLNFAVWLRPARHPM